MCDYFISDGNNQYISTKNGIHAVEKRSLATIMNLSKASNVLKMIPKQLANLCNWTLIPVPENSASNEDLESMEDFEFISLDQVINGVSELASKAEQYSKYAKTINTQLHEIQLEIEDIYHYIEFSNFNAAQGYQAYKMLKQRLIKRRELKDSQILLDKIQEKNLLTCNIGDVKETVNKLESRSYRPRILKELFG